jgi:hypothetical protein
VSYCSEFGNTTNIKRIPHLWQCVSLVLFAARQF